MKFSDILKRKASPPPQEPVSPSPAVAEPSVSPAPVPLTEQAAPQAAPSALDESPEVAEKRVTQQNLKATEVYREAVAISRKLHRAVQDPETAGPQELPLPMIQSIITTLKSGNQELLVLADRSAPDNYLYGHAVNVAIFSLYLGIVLKFSDADLESLGLGAFLHDLGMVFYLPIVLKSQKLTGNELLPVHQHPEDGEKALSLFPSLQGALKEMVQTIIVQSHERIENNGYPKKLATDTIHEQAKIVSVCDTYEAMTHERSWRPRTLPHSALKKLIQEHEGAYDPGVVKSFIEAISLYPPGSFVRLSTGEVGRVINTNEGLPTRPKIKVLVDSKGNRVPGPKIINLATQPIVFVSEAVDETKIQSKDQRLLLELRAQRWWVKDL